MDKKTNENYFTKKDWFIFNWISNQDCLGIQMAFIGCIVYGNNEKLGISISKKQHICC